MDKKHKIFVAGHCGMLGSAIVRQLKKQGMENLVLMSRGELDLRDALAVKDFFDTHRPDVVILSAARVGGIQANINSPVEFLYENLKIQNNVITEAHNCNVKKFCFVGSSCIYPAKCAQPMKEEYLLTGSLEPTNEGYALAKIVGTKLVEYYRKQYAFSGITVIPCNLYGTNDSFDPLHSHVLSALVRKFVDAVDNQLTEISMWGSGVARREFMHVDDAANAIIFMTQNYDSPKLINVGWGQDVSIKGLAELIAAKTNYKGKINCDTSKPDGMLRKCLDVSRIKELGFHPEISLEEGIERTIGQYKNIKAVSF